ncbi:sensor histidine kinase [Corynebacterium poyangense]|uniref:Sensor-like histidine kinase SenX3 n=1 Tax=Corynebacterium poyangense TaxID=2684405 RepID=A0A7H0SLT8_9CORY|nr:ATP-binding protein [Corynebacterium poyangense]MBZ8177620.1 sensor histidine kinase [Corynebacterium poyangense]QNQ89513.1 sensor histidine kinase [Corynebacterium poyangense]
MTPLFAFILGILLTAVAAKGYRVVRKRLQRFRSSETLARNEVTTVSQVLHLAIQGSPTGITVIDRSGEVILSNPHAHDMGVVHERNLNPEVWSCAEHVFEDQETRSIDLRVPMRRPGSLVTAVSAVIKPLTLVDNRFVIVYAADESENVRMEAARRDFVANVSHELKTPVGGMALLAEAVVEGSDDPDQVEYFGTRLHKEAHRLADMINELIALSKLQGAEALPDMEPVPVSEIIDDAFARNQLSAENAGITLIKGPDQGILVNGDKALLVTALANLISNAINYSPNAMPVSVSQKTAPDDTVLIRVTDRGIGISPENQKRVFERFFRVDKARSRSTGGTGLGLAIVKHVVANHGGTISLWSRVGTGSTFTIKLPIYHPDTPAEAEDSVEDTPSPIRKAVSKVTPRRKDRNSS